MTDRIGCCVPFCRRTRKKQGTDGVYTEWICGDHWRAVPKVRRQAYARIRRTWRRFRCDSDVTRCDRIWFRLKRQAIESAAGIR